MLRIIPLEHHAFGFKWAINPITGSLFKSKAPSTKFAPPQAAPNTKIPPKVIDALYFVNNPYKLFSESQNVLNAERRNASNPDALKIYSRLRWLGNRLFLPSIIYASYTHPIYRSTTEAFEFLNNLVSPQDYSDNCLQKVLFIAKTSLTFAEYGVAFIGAHLPTGQMHAWSIENKRQLDQTDRAWINYTPLIALVKS